MSLTDAIAFLSFLGTIGVGIYAGSVATKLARLERDYNQASDEADAKAERRRFFINLWDKFHPLNDINPLDPIEVDVRYAINLFELVALSWQADVVDKEMVALAFGNQFNLITNQLQQSSVRLPSGKTPAELLNAHRHIEAVRNEINAELQKRSSITTK